eukprot:2663022-Rhodomonas_salina.1
MFWYKQGATPMVYTYKYRSVCDEYSNTNTAPSRCTIHLAIKIPPKSPAKKRRRGWRGLCRGYPGYPGRSTRVVGWVGSTYDVWPFLCGICKQAWGRAGIPLYYQGTPLDGRSVVWNVSEDSFSMSLLQSLPAASLVRFLRPSTAQRLPV